MVAAAVAAVAVAVAAVATQSSSLLARCHPPRPHSSSSSASPFPFSYNAALIANAASPPSMVPSMVGCCVAHSADCQPHLHCRHPMPRMRDAGTREVQLELLRLNVRTRQFWGRDPDMKNVANLFGLETTNKVSVSWMVHQVSSAPGVLRIFECHKILLDVPIAGLLQIVCTLWGDPEDEIWQTH